MTVWNIEPLFICSLAFWVSCLLCLALSPIFSVVLAVFVLWLVRVLYIIWISVLRQICVLQISSLCAFVQCIQSVPIARSQRYVIFFNFVCLFLPCNIYIWHDFCLWNDVGVQLTQTPVTEKTLFPPFLCFSFVTNQIIVYIWVWVLYSPLSGRFILKL